jgi:hypothetical protein
MIQSGEGAITLFAAVVLGEAFQPAPSSSAVGRGEAPQ